MEDIILWWQFSEIKIKLVRTENDAVVFLWWRIIYVLETIDTAYSNTALQEGLQWQHNNIDQTLYS